MFQKSTLNNGLNILTYSMKNVYSVAINILVKSGSRYENKEQNGISHFLEHMSFKCTKNRSTRQIAEDFDAIGGVFNAYTSKECIVYYVKVVSEYLYKAMEILFDVVLNPVFYEDDINKEYGVICQEIAHVIDVPEDLAYEEFFRVAFSGALGRSILGSVESIKEFGSKDFLNYIESYFSTNNIFISVAGNIYHNDVVEFCSKFFINKSSKVVPKFESANYIGGQYILEKETQSCNFLLGFQGFSYMKLERIYANVLSLILGGGVSSRLFQRIREDLGISYSVGAYNTCYNDIGLFTIYASTAPENFMLLIDELIIQLRLICDNISLAELNRAKEQLKVNFMLSEEQTSYKSSEIVKNYALKNKYVSMEEALEDIFQVTIAKLLNIANLIFSSKPSIVAIGPGSKNIDYDYICQQIQK